MFSRRKRADPSNTGRPRDREVRTGSTTGHPSISKASNIGIRLGTKSSLPRAVIVIVAVLVLFLYETTTTIKFNAEKTEFSDRPPHFITVVMPSVVDPHHRRRRIQAIIETWAADARALIVMHNLTLTQQDYPTLQVWSQETALQPIDKTLYPQVLHLPSNITADDEDGFRRLEYAIRHVHEEHDADFTFLVNDHTYVIPEHLCRYLRSVSPNSDFYAGRAMKNPGIVFNSGAAGYLLSRTTVKRLLTAWKNPHPQNYDDDGGAKCRPTQPFHRSNPDLVVAECLQSFLKVPALDTRDESSDNHDHRRRRRHRFHSYGLVRTVQGKVDDWFRNVHDRFENETGFDESYRTLSSGPDCCADDTVSFHYVEAVETRALFRIRQRLLQRLEEEGRDVTDADLLEVLQQQWPTQELGGYSTTLPLHNASVVKDVMTVLRGMSRRDLQQKC